MFNDLDKKRRILVIDDNMPMRKMLESMLTNLGLDNVAVAIDGEAGWQVIQDDDIDLVICDYLMPKINGLELLNLIRESKEYFNLPFIMITGADQRGEFVNTLQAEVDSYLIKPVTADILEESILQVFAQQKSTSPYLKAVHTGKHNYIHGKLDQALKNFLLAQAIMPGLAKPYYYLGRINRELGDDDKAEGFLLHCLDLEGGYINAIIELAGIYTSRKDYPQMYKYLQLALEVSPDNIDVYLDLATAALKLDDMAGVRSHLKKASKLAKNQRQEVEKVVDAYITAGLLEEADYLYGKRLEGDNNEETVKFWNRLGLVAKKMGKLDKAKNFYLSALRLIPQSKAVNYNIALLLFEIGEPENATAYLSKILRIHPNFKQADDLMRMLRKQLKERKEDEIKIAEGS